MRGNTITKKRATPGEVPVIAGGQEPAYYHNRANRSGETIAVAGSGAYSGFVSYWDKPVYVSDAFSVHPNDSLIPKYVFYFLKNRQTAIYSTQTGSGVPHVYGSYITRFEIPVSPLSVQKEIVDKLDRFEALSSSLTEGLPREIALRQKQYEYYRNQLLNFPKKA